MTDDFGYEFANNARRANKEDSTLEVTVRRDVVKCAGIDGGELLTLQLIETDGTALPAGNLDERSTALISDLSIFDQERPAEYRGPMQRCGCVYFTARRANQSFGEHADLSVAWIGDALMC